MYIQTYINKYNFKTKVLTKPREIMLGMMGKKFDNKFDALLFVMNTEFSSFWMKNCIVPLDIIFVKDGIIINIHHNCPPCNTEHCKTYFGVGNLILEMPGGTCNKLNIKKGDHVYLED